MTMAAFMHCKVSAWEVHGPLNVAELTYSGVFSVIPTLGTVSRLSKHLPHLKDCISSSIISKGLGVIHYIKLVFLGIYSAVLWI